jgi:hypothetical protein
LHNTPTMKMAASNRTPASTGVSAGRRQAEV